jgi:hypothetical protein
METTRHKIYKNTSFKPGDLKRVFTKIMSEHTVTEEAISLSAEFRYGDDGKVKKEISMDDLNIITDFYQNTDSVYFSLSLNPERLYDKDSRIMISRFGGGILLNLSSNNTSFIEPTLKILEIELQLVEMPKPIYKENRDVEIISRIEILEAKIQELSRQLSCFLSYRFNAKGKALALELSRFLSLLGVKVVSGLGYEPRRIIEKVTERLKSGHDFLVYLITKESPRGQACNRAIRMKSRSM